MMVTFVSQCEKNALKKTRRVLDAFANRIGDNTWQTLITEEGLLTVKKMLRQSASRSTAVSCHWIRSRSRSQFLWVVGNKKKFNLEGVVPVNSTEREQVVHERFALNTEVIANLAAIAGYFHDLGKANKLFQIKLGALNNERQGGSGTSTIVSKNYEPLRHEWISLRMFQAFVGQKTDKQWLQSLATINNQTAKEFETALPEFQDLLASNIPNPFTTLPPIANMVAWLIVSHHRLPQFPKSLPSQPNIEHADQWRKIFEACWNSPQVADATWNQAQKLANWDFTPFGTPFNSAFWQANIADLAKRALECQRLFTKEWHQSLFAQHLARLSLMLADHAESSLPQVKNNDSDRNYLAFANTGKNEQGQHVLKQKLDDHNIKVGKLAYEIACTLPSIKSKLSTLGKIKALESPVPSKSKTEFGWQDKAVKLAQSLQEIVKDTGFFGISMASTGKGKTRANAKIMYALSEPKKCRFSVALGLRTLSIQTAKALRNDLFEQDEKSQQLAREKVALLVGSQAVRDLQQIDLTQNLEAELTSNELNGSSSAEPLLKDEVELLSDLNLALTKSFKWLQHDPKILKLLHAPILVSTIDYLIPATDGVRGGRQIAPMLRLLSSDLVLDEPDDFSMADFPALCRLVNWAGMLGSKVLISTATIMPSEAEALFDAYQHGRAEYVKANGQQQGSAAVCCAWFDEFNEPKKALVENKKTFAKAHLEFASVRDIKLAKNDLHLRQAKLVEINTDHFSTPSQSMAARIYQSIIDLHPNHAVALAGKRVSIGLVRMANINPLVAVAKHLQTTAAPENTRIHYCIYHGQYPLLQRSSMEQMLDKALKRNDVELWSQTSGLAEIVSKSAELDHIFVVLATSVAEVGRDHDYDWAVVEPSSMRSIIQLAGRVQRHRKLTPNTHNIHVLSKNFKGLKNEKICFAKPGFETKRIGYAAKNLAELNTEKVFSSISAATRIVKPIRPDITHTQPPKFKTFAQLEHTAQSINLYGNDNMLNYAARWWQHDLSWCGEIQRLQPFRKSHQHKDYRLEYFERNHKYLWCEKVEGSYPIKYQKTQDIEVTNKPLLLAQGISIWHQFDLAEQVKLLSKQLGKSEQHTLEVHTHVSLQEYDQASMETWIYQTELGIYKLLTKDEFNNDK
ncbi:type I-F CRISPR-associated helicase Cas3f [Shewanella algae]|uniref:type I-F CRISPR-associated helicase Cas3f n=1 Tax=Shewanella algae TaxID=38313 RepID=UPI0031F4AA40